MDDSFRSTRTKFKQWLKCVAICAAVTSLSAQAKLRIDASGRLSSNGLVRMAEKNPSGHRNISVDEFEKLSSRPNHVILDVRTPKEFAAGHLAGATNIDLYASEFESKIKSLDRSKNYLVHCAVGGRSALAAQKMSQWGFGSVYNLEGGFKAWQKAGKKVEK